MTRDERRASIVEATAPLLEQYGQQLTTRQIADAAGVAEGTVFRAFDSLQEVIEATVTAALSPERLDEVVAAAQFPGTLRGDVECAFDVIDSYLKLVRSAFHIGHNGPSHDDNARCAREQLLERYTQLSATLAERFEAHADELAVEPSEFVGILLALATGQRGCASLNTTPLGRDLLVATILDGTRKPA